MIELGLIGFPLRHSLSPKIHTTAMKSVGLEGNYSLFPIPGNNMKEIERILNFVRSGEILGLNVTIPYKKSILPLLDNLTPIAQTIGAINTISMRNGLLIGDNTDYFGFLHDLGKFVSIEPNSRRCKNNALVLGAGGSAQAVVYGLVNSGWFAIISARRNIQAKNMIKQFSNFSNQLSIVDYNSSSIQSLMSTYSLIINTTPIGMFPNTKASPWFEKLPFPKNAVLYDLIYNPMETKLVHDARFAGLRATNGLGMLIEQAALAFEIWTGLSPSRDILWNALVTKN